MAVFDKNDVDLDTTIINLKLILKGRRDILNIQCSASQACDFVDHLNENESVYMNKFDKQKFDNKFYHFDDIAGKKTVSVALTDVRYMEIPYFFDKGENLELKVLTYNN